MNITITIRYILFLIPALSSLAYSSEENTCKNPSLVVSEQGFSFDFQKINNIDVLNLSSASVHLVMKDGMVLDILTIDEEQAGGSEKVYKFLGVKNFRSMIEFLAEPEHPGDTAGSIRRAHDARQASDLHIRDMTSGWLYWSADFESGDSRFIHIVRNGDARIIRLVVRDPSAERIQWVIEHICF